MKTAQRRPHSNLAFVFPLRLHPCIIWRRVWLYNVEFAMFESNSTTRSHLTTESSPLVLMTPFRKKGMSWLSPTGGECAGVVSVSRLDGIYVAFDSLARLGADENLPARSMSQKSYTSCRKLCFYSSWLIMVIMKGIIVVPR